MSNTVYSALIITVSVQFIEFDFFNLILILVIQYSKLLQHIGSNFFSIIVFALLSCFTYSFMRFCDTILPQSDR